MTEIKHGLPLLLLVCILIGILCSIVSACTTRNVAEAVPKQECKIISVSDVENYSTTLITCPEKSYRCFRYISGFSDSTSCVSAGR